MKMRLMQRFPKRFADVFVEDKSARVIKVIFDALDLSQIFFLLALCWISAAN